MASCFKLQGIQLDTICLSQLLYEPMEETQNFGQSSGTMLTVAGAIGYIKDDIGTDVSVVPSQCIGYGGVLPAVGTRVIYDITVDAVGNMKAEGVKPEEMVLGPPFHASASSTDHKALALSRVALAPPLVTGLAPQLVATSNGFSQDRSSGIFSKEKGSYGFIKQDSGQDDLFVMPRECTGFGGMFPQLGARVVFELASNNKTGKPKAQNVRPGCSGTMSKNKGSFGFISQDSGEPDLFVMPRQCAYFGGNFPDIGTRVVYEVTMNMKTGKPCAEDVQPMFKLPAVGLVAGEQICGMLELDPTASLLALKDGLHQEPFQDAYAAVTANAVSIDEGAKRRRLLPG